MGVWYEVMQIGDDFYEDLTPETTVKVLNALAKGERPKPGPQSGRHTSENGAGRTALTSKVSVSEYPVIPLIADPVGFVASWARAVLSARLRID